MKFKFYKLINDNNYKNNKKQKIINIYKNRFKKK